MAEVVVTRADREAAARLSFVSLKRPEIRAYVETGDGAADSYCDVHDIARVIARARAEGFAAGREAERRDARAVLDKSAVNAELRERSESGWRSTALEAMARVLRSVIAQLDTAEHVGAADKERGE